MQAGEHPVRLQMLIQQPPEVPELRAHQKADRVDVRRFSVNLRKKLHRLLRFALHQLAKHRFDRAAVAAAEKQGAVVVMPGQQLKIFLLLGIDRAENILRLRTFLFSGANCKIVVSLP